MTRSVCIREFGGPDVLRVPMKPALPTSIGFEAAGVIEALGPEVSGFAVGDRVALVLDPPRSRRSMSWHGT